MVAIIILSILLVAALAYIFYFTKVFFRTFVKINSIQNNILTEDIAYDGKYYPATVIAQAYLNSEISQIITDFSLYDEKEIIGFFIYSQENGDDQMKALLNNPVIIPNAIVYQKEEGLWTWDST